MDSNKPKKNFILDSNGDGTFDLIEYAVAAVAVFLIMIGAVAGLVGAYQGKKDFSGTAIGFIGTGTGILIKRKD